MKRHEHILIKLAEECVEVAQRATKALSFGLDEVQPGDDNPNGLNNAQRIVKELEDVIGVVEMLQDEKHLAQPTRHGVEAKKVKVEKYLLYSRECGTLEDR